MEINDQNLQQLAEFLQKTLDPNRNVRKPGKEINLILLISVIAICSY